MPEYRERTRIRDSQRSHLYEAERKALVEHPDVVRIETIAEIQVYVNRILGSPWYEAYDPPDKLEPWSAFRKKTTAVLVKDGRGSSSARAHRSISGPDLIKMPKWSRSTRVILHEVAHCIQTQDPWHGRQFAQIYLDLVEQWISLDARDALYSAYTDHRVKWTRLARRHPQRKPSLGEQVAEQAGALGLRVYGHKTDRGSQYFTFYIGNREVADIHRGRVRWFLKGVEIGKGLCE